MAAPVPSHPPRPRSPAPVAAALVVLGLLLVLAVQLLAPDVAWLRLAAVVVAVGAPMLVLVLGLRAGIR